MDMENGPMVFSMSDLIITIAYFSIPLQIVYSLCLYPRLHAMPLKIFVLVILFALFVFLCGAGHLMRCLGAGHTEGFAILNDCTAFISFLTAVYLLPLVPNLMSTLDEGLQELIRLNEETQESRSKLITFMAFLCHEIRNPLFAVTSSISFMEDGDLSEEQERALRSIGQSTNLMLRLVNDVLDISKLESGKLELEERNFDFQEMAQNVAASTETQIKAHPNVDFRFNMSPEVPSTMVGDSVRILQILYNLLSNAVKFTEKGSITFGLSVTDYDMALLEGVIEKQTSSRKTAGCKDRGAKLAVDGDAESAMNLLHDVEEGVINSCAEHVVLKVVVADTGPGIAPDRISEIFKPYSQKLSDYRKHGGTGLGLSIITKILRLMGGSIQVESEEGEGATFTVFIPLRVAHGSCTESTDDSKNIISKSISTSRLPDILSPSLQNLPLFTGQKASVSKVDPEMRIGTPVTLPTQQSSTSSSWMATSLGEVPSPHSPILRSSSSMQSPSSVMNQSVLAMDESLTSPLSPRKRQLTKFNLASNDNVVLVVDDNLLNRKLLGKMLDHFNLEHQFACDGQEAVDAMLRSRNHTGKPDDPQFSLIIMDQSMPVMGGAEATRVIRGHGMMLPILALTANAIEGSRLDALEAGATEFLTKPILREDLHAKCFHYLAPAFDAIDPSADVTPQQPGLLGESKSID